jgi:DNA-binding FadR family transcriptional regulator
MIMDGEITPGTRLSPERDLADRFRVSRPTLREAMHVLGALRAAAIAEPLVPQGRSTKQSYISPTRFGKNPDSDSVRLGRSMHPTRLTA